VLVRQRPSTARGITFVTIEDETGLTNLVVRPDVWQRFHKAARRAGAMLVTGRLERQQEVIHLVVAKIEDLSERLREVRVKSRDFQ
jgi:error-prone DNA polymerase